MSHSKKTRKPLRSPSAVLSSPPVCPRETHTMSHHGDMRCDPYYWMRDRRRAEVRPLLQWHNAHTKSVMDAMGGSSLTDSVYRDMRARLVEDDASLPLCDRGFWYYTRHIPNADYPIFCRRRAHAATASFETDVATLWALDPHASLPRFADEEVFLDPNLLLRELRLRCIDVGDMDFTPDGQRMAVALDCSNGREVYTILVMDITDVNYARWLQSQSGLCRAWADAMTRSQQSIYSSPVSSLPRSSPASVSSITTNGNGKHVHHHFPKRRRCPTHVNGFPGEHMNGGEPHSGVGHEVDEANRACVNDKEHSSPGEDVPDVSIVHSPVDPIATTTTAAAATAAGAAVTHRVVRRIDVFDAGSEVLWMNATGLLYLGIDATMRTCRVVYHDLTQPPESEAADTVCYEEPDEALWVGSLEFTVDGRFATFCVGSTDSTATYVLAADVGRRRYVSHVPIVPGKGGVMAEESDTERPLGDVYPTKEDRNTTSKEDIDGRDNDGHGEMGGEGHVLEAASAELNIMTPLAWKCFAPRVEGVEYDIEHHESLLGDGIGAWIIIINDKGRLNFGVDFVPDAEWGCEVTHQEQQQQQRRALFAYDPHIKLEGVDCARGHLLLSVRRAAAATVLLVDITLLHARWAATPTWVPLSLRHDTIDLCAVFLRVTQRGGTMLSMCAADPAPCVALVELMTRSAAIWEDAEQMKSGDWQLYEISCSTGNTAFEAEVWRLIVTHPIIPAVTFACQLCPNPHPAVSPFQSFSQWSDKALSVVPLRKEVVGGAAYNPSDYGAHMIWVPSDFAFTNSPLLTPLPTATPAEGAKVPVVLIWRGRTCPVEAAVYLTVYGAYGECNEAEFVSDRLALLDRGVVWAAACVRGGGELGVPWRDAGRRLQRATAVNDFISCAAFLQRNGCCAAGQLIAAGASAGGLVVAAAMNAAPELFHAVVAAVPFVDCLTTLLDPSLPLTVSDWEEYGNPREDQKAYWALRAISPMDNIPNEKNTQHRQARQQPPLLLQTAWHDTRVGYWESLAFAHRLRDAHGEGQLVLHYCNFGVGHGGSSGRYERLREVALEYGFALATLQST